MPPNPIPIVHKLPPEFLDRTINVALIGVGGNGSQMLTGLARLHVTLLALGHPSGLSVFVYDPDVVTESNVGRQLFSPADVGLPKARVLIHRVNAFFGLNWTAEAREFPQYQTHWQFLVSCVDSAKARRQIHQFAASTSARLDYWLDLGNASRTGQVILGQPLTRANREETQRLRTVMDIFPELLDPAQPEDTTPSCSLAQALDRQDLFINQSLATMALHLMWTLLRRGEIAHHGYFVNLEAGTTVPMKVVDHGGSTMNEMKGPFRKVVKIIAMRRCLMEAHTLKLACGHVVQGYGMKKARCNQCGLKAKLNVGQKRRKR